MQFGRPWSRAPSALGGPLSPRKQSPCPRIPRTVRQLQRLPHSWTRSVQRGEVFRLRPPRDTRGRELLGVRYGVVVQADELMALSTVVVAPTSTSVCAASFRPEVSVAGETTRVVVEQMRAVDPSRLGDSAGLL